MQNSQIWTEKFRPAKFEEIAGQKEIIRKIKALVETKNIPHMLFSGPAGVGKTTLSLVIAKELHKGNWRSNFLELNASDTRGIDIIRNEVKNFAKTMAVNTDAPKIILLDEADALTKEAQQALRRTMETYSNSCRFILSCNIVSKIIDPIKSRCAVFRFKPLNVDEINDIILKVKIDEKLNIGPDITKLLYEKSGGDVRQIYNILQSSSAISKNITKDNLSEFMITVSSDKIQEIISLALDKKFLESRSKLLGIMLENGLSGIDIIKQLQGEVLNMQIDDNKKFNIIERCGEIEFRLVEGSDDFIQLESFIAFIAKI